MRNDFGAACNVTNGCERANLAMSAIAPKADIADSVRDVRFVPKADISALPNRNAN
jgi:hypothetical protein